MLLAAAVVAIGAPFLLAALSESPAPDSAGEQAPTCSRDYPWSQDFAHQGFPFREVTNGGPLLDRYLEVELHPRAGHLCVAIVTDHADTGAETTSYSIAATRRRTTWLQEGTDPSHTDPMRINVRGCVGFEGTMTVTGYGGKVHEYRAKGRLGINCTTRRTYIPH